MPQSKVSDNAQVVILGAGRSARSNLPAALVDIDSGHRVLDWLLHSFSVLGAPDIHFVGGYKINEITRSYPEIRFHLNADWEETASGVSLSLVPMQGSATTYVSYSDVLFRPEFVKRIGEAQGDLVLAVDSQWRFRYDRRSRSELDDAEKVLLADGEVLDIGKAVPTRSAYAEYAGLMKMSATAVARMREHIGAHGVGRTDSIPDLIRQLIRGGLKASLIDVRGNWAELNAPQDLARFVLGTKAESLARLKPLLRGAEICDLVSFTHERWRQDAPAVIDEVREAMGDTTLIVRSSALSEDSWSQSAAGAFKSLLNVTGDDPDALRVAVDEVFASYDEVQPGNQVLVQPMLKEVTMSGVVMTRSPTVGAPYYVINFDDTGSTDSVTSGTGSRLRTVFLHRGAKLGASLPAELHKLIDVVVELEDLVGHDSLDVEFAFTTGGAAHILQVRPIVVPRHDEPLDDEDVAQSLSDAKSYIESLQQPSPFLAGSTTYLSVMADWNPAEMIGTKPSRLAFSLYRYLITDEAWGIQRVEYGYRDVRPCNLIVDILGHPYVDMRVDFNSFVPAVLPERFAERLVDHYLDKIKRSPELHDKVEFDVLHTCMTFDFDERAADLTAAGFSAEDVALLRESLRDITKNGIARCAADVDSLRELERRYTAIRTADLPPLERVHALLDDTRRLGIVQFSHLARQAFVAMRLLGSLEATGRLQQAEIDAFLRSLRTVATVMQEDAAAVASGSLAWDEFVARYGHLRPGSYDITSPCYASAAERFLGPMVKAARGSASKTPADPWDDAVRGRIDDALRSIDLGVDVRGLEAFLRQAIEGREFAKFTFMRNLNSALEALAEFGAAHGVDRQGMTHVHIQDFFQMRGAPTLAAKKSLDRAVHEGREASYTTHATSLPAQIFSSAELTCFERLRAEPNFITSKAIRARVLVLSGEAGPEQDISGLLVVIPNADPGYDWLFSRDIAGLITMYGGVNSHMAIRAAEFGLPAVIGVGELLFEAISQAETVEVDCGARRISVVS